MIEKLLKKLVRLLDKNGIPYMIIGGQAVLLYGRPRLTEDIDITLGVDVDRYTDVESICKKLQFKILPPDPLKFVKETKVLPTSDPVTGMKVDFIFSFTPYEKQAFKRVKRVSMKSCWVKFASVEDIVIHKIFAGRAIDLEDTRIILLKNKVDRKYIRRWLVKFSHVNESKNLVKIFNSIL